MNEIEKHVRETNDYVAKELGHESATEEIHFPEVVSHWQDRPDYDENGEPNE